MYDSMADDLKFCHSVNCKFLEWISKIRICRDCSKLNFCYLQPDELIGSDLNNMNFSQILIPLLMTYLGCRYFNKDLQSLELYSSLSIGGKQSESLMKPCPLGQLR